MPRSTVIVLQQAPQRCTAYTQHLRRTGSVAVEMVYNQMRDIFFEEIETDDPVGWLRDFVKGKDVELTVDEKESGDLTVFVESGGVTQKFLFTRL